MPTLSRTCPPNCSSSVAIIWPYGRQHSGQVTQAGKENLAGPPGLGAVAVAGRDAGGPG